RLT
ncbi:unnamed protein product, partial [Acanthoscelides obtectus]